MIDKTEMVSLLEEVFPENPRHWRNNTEADLSALCLHLIDCIQAQKTERFEALFGVVERGVIEGEPETQEFLIVGLLENLKNLASWQDLDYAIFESWLGPETHIAWRWLEKKWLGKNSLADTVRIFGNPENREEE
jgi:hypothetical protein